MRPITIIVAIALFLSAACHVSCDEYRIDAEDVLSITVYDQPDLESKVRVTAQGEITFPLVGAVKVKGLTVSEVESRLAQLLEADYLVNPKVSVFIEKYHVKKVSVLGAVEKPGVYELSSEKPSTVLEAIAMAGGLSKNASLADARIMRVEGGKEETIPVDLTAITKYSEKQRDIALRAGDVVFVPEGYYQIFVLGAVEKPGSYELSKEKPTTALEAIAMAGGFSKVAAQNDTKVIRKDANGSEETIRVRAADITQKGEKDKDIPLQPKDVVFVPESFF